MKGVRLTEFWLQCGIMVWRQAEIGLTYAIYLGSFVAALAVALPLSAWGFAQKRGQTPSHMGTNRTPPTTGRGQTPFLCKASASRRSGPHSVVVGLMTFLLMSNLIAYFYFERNLLFPYMRNVITPFGIFTPDAYLLGVRPLLWGQPTAMVVTGLCGLGFVALLQRVSGREWNPRERPRWITIRLATCWLAWQLAYIAGTTPLLFDRHLLILAPSSVLLFVTLTPPGTRWNRLAFAAVVLPLGYYSLASSHDLHAESRLAFQAGRDLLAEGVHPAKINGGYAFDGWYLYETHSTPVPVRPMGPWWGSQNWDDFGRLAESSGFVLNAPPAAWWSGPVRPQGDVDYVISLSLPSTNLKGIEDGSGGLSGGGERDNNPVFQEIRRYPFVSGWSGRTKFVHVLQRIPTRSGIP